MDSRVKHTPRLILAYARRGEDGLSEIEDRVEGEAHDRPNGKFGKKEAVYSPQSPLPPTLWKMNCGRCRFWEEGEPGEPGQCHIVGRDDDSFGGEAIHYRGWCAYWMPPEGEPPFAWFRERFRPEGKSSVRGKYDTAMTEKERRRQPRTETSTEPDARRKAVRGEGDDDDG